MKSILSKNSLTIPVIGGFLVSFFMLFYGRPINLAEAFTSQSFYIALLVSSSVAILLVYIIHQVNLFLNRKYDWIENSLERASMQFLFGVALPALIDFTLLYVYFDILGQSIIDNGFLLIDYPVILCFIVILNLYYLVVYFLGTRQEQVLFNYANNDYINILLKDTTSATYVVSQNGKQIVFDLVQDVFCFYRDIKYVKLVTFQAQEYTIKETLGDLVQQFTDNGFQKINRSIALNLNTVKGYQNGKNRNTLKLIFKEKYAGLMNHIGAEQFIVTKENIASVRDKLLEV